MAYLEGVQASDSDLDELLTELEVLLSHRHPAEVQKLFEYICAAEIEERMFVSVRGVRAVFAWGEAELDGYCTEVLG